MDMVIISTISDDGTLMEQYLVREKEGIKKFMDILRMHEAVGFNVRGGDIVKLYEDGRALLEKNGHKLVLYVREREVI